MAKDIQRANRMCCDVDIRDYATKKSFLFADFCNTTGLELSADNTYAMKKGQKAIAFANPVESTLTLEMQVHPFKVYTLMADGTYESEGSVAEKKTIKCETAGELSLTLKDNASVVAGTLFVFKHGEIGEDAIEGSFADGKFTATTADEIAEGEMYDVTYIASKTSGVKIVKFTDKKQPKPYFITMSTLDTDEEGNQLPLKITIYKGAPKKSLSFSFSSEGDPATLSIEIDCMADLDGNVIDVVEDDEE